MNMKWYVLPMYYISMQTIATAQNSFVQTTNWTIAATLPYENGRPALGVAGAIAGVHKDVLMVAGGANFTGAAPWLGGKKSYHSAVHIYHKNNGRLVYHKKLQLPFALAYSACVSTPLGIAAVGGENEHGLTDRAFLLKYNTDNDSIQIQPLPTLPYTLANASLVYHKGSIYLLGGEKVDNGIAECWILDLQSPSQWKQIASLPKPVSHAIAVISTQDGSEQIYLIGGRKKNAGAITTFYSSVFSYSISDNRWRQRKPLPYALAAGTGMTDDNGAIIVFGGDRGETFHQTEKLILAIYASNDAESKHQLELSKIQVQSNHPGFSRELLTYSPRKDKWKKAGCLPFATPVTTAAVRWQQKVYLPSGEIKAGVRSAHILSTQLIPK